MGLGSGGVVSADPVALERYDREGRPAHLALAQALTRLRGALADLAASCPDGLRVDHRPADLGWAHLDDTTALAEVAVQVAAEFRRADSRLHGSWPVRDVAPLLRCVVAGATWGVDGGGTLTGPDGESYPVLAPYLVVDGTKRYRPGDGPAEDPFSAGGTDDGWRTVAETADLVDTSPGSLFAAKSGAYAAFGAARVVVANVTVRDRGRVGIVAGGGAFLRPVGPGGAPRVGMGPPHNDTPQRESTTPPPRAQRTKTAYGATSLLVNLVSSWRLASSLDAAQVVAQHVVYERHPDGRRRARVWRYRVVDTAAGTRMDVNVAWRDADGSWREVDAPR